jgi:sugar phosphate isomerase/epimerase
MTMRLTRRQAIGILALGTGVMAGGNWSAAVVPSPVRVKACLSPGSIGVRAGGRQLIDLALKHRFDAVEPQAGYLATLNDNDLAALREEMKRANLAWGAAGLPVDFRGEDAKFEADLERLAPVCATLRRAGVDRVGTWLSPSHGQLSYEENFDRHADRLRKVASVLKDGGQRLGLEYVGTPTLRENRKHTFIYNMHGTRQLIERIGTGNVGFVLDSWHWWTAGEGERDLLSVKAEQIVSVDLNDAPKGIPVERQIDGQRELPCATGVIPVAAFVAALAKLGYDGPARAEPFNKPLNDMDDDDACAASIAALRKVLATAPA